MRRVRRVLSERCHEGFEESGGFFGDAGCDVRVEERRGRMADLATSKEQIPRRRAISQSLRYVTKRRDRSMSAIQACKNEIKPNAEMSECKTVK
eukprot:230928-Pleurochrysis_carterae.AAC.2